MATLFKNLELEFAKVASRGPQMDAAAQQIQGEIISKSPHHSGAYKRSIKTETVRTRRGVRDRVIYTDDEQAHIIEWGRMAPNGQWIPGHFIFTGISQAYGKGGNA